MIGKWITPVASAAAIVGFLLPWIASHGFTITETQSGLDFATSGTSAASGWPMWPYFITLIAAVVCLCVSLVFIRSYPNRWDAAAAVAAALIGLAPLLMLRAEIGRWDNMETDVRLGLVMTLVGLLGVIVGSIVAIVEDARHRAGAQRDVTPRPT